MFEKEEFNNKTARTVEDLACELDYIEECKVREIVYDDYNYCYSMHYHIKFIIKDEHIINGKKYIIDVWEQSYVDGLLSISRGKLRDKIEERVQDIMDSVMEKGK